MRTDKQKEAARLNGAKSTGPKTPEGRERSSQNARKHGLTGSLVVLETESPERWHSLLDDCIARWKPQGAVEHHLVTQIAATMWKTERSLRIETGLLNLQLHFDRDNLPEALPDVDETVRLSWAWKRATVASEAIDRIGKYQLRLNRTLHRLIRTLAEVQTSRPPIDDDLPNISVESESGKSNPRQPLKFVMNKTNPSPAEPAALRIPPFASIGACPRL